jgi:hypothetical protein
MAINDLTLNYLAKGINNNNKEAVREITVRQGHYVNHEQEFPAGLANMHEENPIAFFKTLAGLRKFHFFGDFHCRLQYTSMSEAAAERKIKHAKRMISKHRYSTSSDTIVLYMKASSRKDFQGKK